MSVESFLRVMIGMHLLLQGGCAESEFASQPEPVSTQKPLTAEEQKQEDAIATGVIIHLLQDSHD